MPFLVKYVYFSLIVIALDGLNLTEFAHVLTYEVAHLLEVGKSVAEILTSLFKTRFYVLWQEVFYLSMLFDLAVGQFISES